MPAEEADDQLQQDRGSYDDRGGLEAFPHLVVGQDLFVVFTAPRKLGHPSCRFAR